MPKKYKRPAGTRAYKCYTAGKLAEALQKMKRGRSIRSVAKEYNIPTGTLSHKMRDKHSRSVGTRTVFSKEEETEMVEYVLKLAEWGFPMDLTDIRMVAKNILEKQGRTVIRFRNNIPSSDWASAFLRRHKQRLTQRTCQNIKSQRAGVNHDTVNEFYRNMEETLTGADGQCVPPDLIFNYDETNLSDNPGTKKCVFKRGCKYPERVMTSTKSSTSVMFCGSASGEILPPYVVYKADHMWSTWTDGGPRGSRFNRSKSGWFDEVSFTDWFETLFIPTVANRPGRKVLIGDNLSSHFSKRALKLAAEHNIQFVCLPSNATHLMQPLDVAFFGPMKREWRKILDDWKTGSRNTSATVTKEWFPRLLTRLMENLQIADRASSNLKAGFRATGIYPLNSEKVMKRLPDKNPVSVEPGPSGSISGAVLEFLHNRRSGGHQRPAKRRRKIDVPPGRSISREDLHGSSTSSEPPTSSVSDQEVSMHAAENPMELEDPVETSTDSSLSAVPGSFYLVGFKTRAKHGYKAYAAMCVSTDSGIEMKFMRKTKDNSNSFCWPEEPDQVMIEADQILAKLRQPGMDRRGRLIFTPEDISSYREQLG